MQKKGLTPMIIATILLFILATSMILLEEKKLTGLLTGFAVYNTSNTPCSQTMTENSTFSENVNCVELNGLTITCSECTLDCQGHVFGGIWAEGTKALIITGSNVTIKNCNLQEWYINISLEGGSCIDGGGNNIGDISSVCSSSGCVENIVNSTPTDWTDVGCVGINMNQTRNFTEYDTNNCGTFQNVTHYEYRLLNASLANVSTDWINVGCVGSSMNQSRNITQYDSLNLGCYQNETFVESQLVGPEWLYTSWSDWQNLSCSGRSMNQSRSRIKYDSYACAENITEYEYQLVGPNYVNVSIGNWTDFSCVNSSTKNQSRIIVQQDSYNCSDERNITEYQSVACSSGYVCSDGQCIASTGGGGGGSGGSTCTNECLTAGSIICSSETSYKICGNYDSDSCLELSEAIECPAGKICLEGNCIAINCTENWVCEEWSNCTNKKQTRVCRDINSCSSQPTKTETRECEEITEKAEETKETGKFTYGGIILNFTKKVPKPSDFIPHGDIPPAIIDSASYGAAVAIVATGLHLIWLWLLALLFPFFLLRLRHFCVAIIDMNLDLPFVQLEAARKAGKAMVRNVIVKTEEITKFIKMLETEMKEKIIYAESIENYYRFLFQKGGFLELQIDIPIILNAHFSSSKRTLLPSLLANIGG
jgi:hypothetical protein